MSLPHDTVALLDELDLFEALTDDEIDALARKVDTVSWEAGTVIFEEGDRGDACYVIHSGRVKVMRRLVDGQPITLAHRARRARRRAGPFRTRHPIGNVAGGRPDHRDRDLAR